LKGIDGPGSFREKSFLTERQTRQPVKTDSYPFSVVPLPFRRFFTSFYVPNRRFAGCMKKKKKGKRRNIQRGSEILTNTNKHTNIINIMDGI
jgi:hypothetical protein